MLNERSKEYYKQDNAKEYTYITADEYTSEQLVDMEKEILNVLNFKLSCPTSMIFLKIYLALFQIPEKVGLLALVKIDLL